jgi:hypothetical protein
LLFKSSPNPSKGGSLELKLILILKLKIFWSTSLELFQNPYSRCPSTSFLVPLAEANGNKKGFPIAIGTPIGAKLKSFGFFLTFGFELQ